MLTLQQLSPPSARLCLEVEKTLVALGIASGSKLLLALSGGSDSTALAVICAIVAPRLGVTLEALHVDHGLRPTSRAEARAVGQFCERWSIPLQVAEVDIAAASALRKWGVEEAGHHCREALLESRRQAIGADFILTGHQSEDLCEDILMRLLRGAGWPALAGMSWRRGYILHPLLQQSPQRLKDLLTSCQVTWITDPSNQSLAFRRNRMRHLLMPMLRCENPAIGQGFQRLHALGALDADYFEQTLDEYLLRTPWLRRPGELILGKKLLEPLHPALRLRLYARALRHFREEYGCPGQNEFSALMAIESLYAARVGGKCIQCAGGIEVRLRKGDLALARACSE